VKRQPSGERDLSALAMFAEELKLARATAGLTQEQVADKIHNHPSLIARIETCRAVPTLDFARRCDEALGTNGVLARMQPQAKRVAFVPGFGQYLQVEESASMLRSWEPLVFSGLLQTEDYARAVTMLGHHGAPAEEIDRRVRLRMARQALIAEPRPVHLWAVLDEAVLRRPAGRPGVMRRQLQHLLEAADRPNVTIQVVPFRAGAHAAAGGAFSILRFAERDLPDVVYLEQLTSALYLDKRETVDHYMAVMERLCLEAAPAASTASAINAVLRDR
jgi:transcriptional regulator with XRE-family HTH domain